jgi:hypothetical protein
VVGEDRPVRVFSAGAPSYGTRHELELLRRLVPELKPDLVLVSFFFANDLSDNVSPSPTVRGGFTMSLPRANLVDSSRLTTFAVEHSDLLTALILRWRHYRDGLVMPAPPTRPPADLLAAIETPSAAEVLLVTVSEETEARWEVAASLLREMRDETAAAGARLVVIAIPLQYQFDDELWRRMCARHGLSAEEYDRGASAKRLGEIATTLGVSFLDLREAFATEPESSALYFAFNKHFTASGHAVAGRAIAEFLGREGLLDG